MGIKDEANGYIGYPKDSNEHPEVTMRRYAFEDGAKWMLDKAIGWLAENLPYVIDEKTFTVRREVLRDFEKAMKG